MVIATAMGLCRALRHSYGRRIWQLGCAHQSGGDAGLRHYFGQLREDRSLLDRASSGRILRSDAGLAVFSAALEADRRPGREARRLLHRSGDSSLSRQPVLRSDWHHAADRRGGGDWFQGAGSDRTDFGAGPYFVSILVWAIGLSLGGTTGYAINPARDFGPRVAHALWPVAGKGSSDWAYAPIPVLGRCSVQRWPR